MTTKQKVIAFTLGAMIAVSLLGCGQPFAQAAEPAKYELTITMTPVAGSALEQKGAKPIVISPKEATDHDSFASKAACEAHFEEADLPGIAIMMLQSGLKIGEDFTVEAKCEAAGTDA